MQSIASLKLRTLGALLALSLLGALMTAAPASADPDIDISLDGFEIIIGDTGDWFDGWDRRETRVYAKVRERGRSREHYFDSLPAALFVLRERYGRPDIVALEVPVYRDRDHGTSGRHGMVDARKAVYIWDYERHSRGGLPLVLAFAHYDDALYELRRRDAEMLDYDGLVRMLDRWEGDRRDRIYWRGWHADRWDSRRWNSAWNRRWDGWNWDHGHGWLNVRVDLDNDRDRWRPRGRGSDRDRWDNDRRRGRGHDDRGRGSDDRGRGRGNDDRGREDRGRGNDDRGGDDDDQGHQRRERQRGNDDDGGSGYERGRGRERRR